MHEIPPQDIDGDGRSASGSAHAPTLSPSSTPTPAGGVDAWTGDITDPSHEHVEQPMHGYTASGTVPTSSPTGPFGSSDRSGLRLLLLLLVLLVVAALGYVTYRAVA